jgi:uncharacterized membrane protein
MRVKCYWNLNQAKQGNYVFSVLAAGKVIGYESVIALANARFHVNHKARLKILGGGKKSVHAWVTGDWVATADSEILKCHGLREATYNPRRDEDYVDVHTGEKLAATSPLVVLKITKVPGYKSPDWQHQYRGAVYYK